MIGVKVSGSFKNAEAFAARMKRQAQFAALGKYGALGVRALAAATPEDSSRTANSWRYEIAKKPGYYAIHWLNSHVEDDIPIAILIQYGHGTKTGGIVQGRDYINPTMRPLFDQIASDMWKEVTK